MSRVKNVAGDIISSLRASTSSPQRLPMVQHFEARMLGRPEKLFYLILSRITGSPGSKIHPDTWSEIKIKMLLSSRITIYHVSWCPVRKFCCLHYIPPCLSVTRYRHQGSFGMWSLIKDQTDPGPEPDLWQIAQSLLVCQAQTFYQTQSAGPVL